MPPSDRRDVPSLGEAIVGFSGYPPAYLGWSQYRTLGAAALDLCAVAEGVLDGYAAVGGSQLGSWDYLGAMLVCTEAGAVVEDRRGDDLVTLDHHARRVPVAAATAPLLASFSAAAARLVRLSQAWPCGEVGGWAPLC